MKKKKILVWALLISAAVILGGCTIRIGGNKAKVIDGGVWKSSDSGLTWIQVADVPASGGKIASIANVNIRRLAFDPNDYETIYLATEDNGLVYTNDGGATWRQFKQFIGAKIRAIAVDPADKCNLYVLLANQLYKSTDCGRFWHNIYFHQNPEVILTDLLIDYNNSSIVYLTTNAGEVLKSIDSGQTWVATYRLKSGTFLDLVMDSKDSRLVCAASQKNGIYKTTDGGLTWASLGEGLKGYTGSQEYKKLIVDEATANSLILVSKFGMLKSSDGGATWTVVELLPAAKKTTIYAVAVNPKNSDEIYYATRTTLVKSLDGGRTWSSQELPFSRSANQIIINPQNPSVLYIGTFKLTE